MCMTKYTQINKYLDKTYQYYKLLRPENDIECMDELNYIVYVCMC